MKLIFLCILFQVSNAISLGTPALEALLVSCQVTGHSLYDSCVITPPTNPATCTSLLATYMACSKTLNSPYPMLISKDPDPYSWSPFDPCRFEVQKVILWDICPSSPIG